MQYGCICGVIGNMKYLAGISLRIDDAKADLADATALFVSKSTDENKLRWNNLACELATLRQLRSQWADNTSKLLSAVVDKKCSNWESLEDLVNELMRTVWRYCASYVHAEGAKRKLELAYTTVTTKAYPEQDVMFCYEAFGKVLQETLRQEQSFMTELVKLIPETSIQPYEFCYKPEIK